jgi:hypothetical protein
MTVRRYSSPEVGDTLRRNGPRRPALHGPPSTTSRERLKRFLALARREPGCDLAARGLELAASLTPPSSLRTRACPDPGAVVWDRRRAQISRSTPPYLRTRGLPPSGHGSTRVRSIVSAPSAIGWTQGPEGRLVSRPPGQVQLSKSLLLLRRRAFSPDTAAGEAGSYISQNVKGQHHGAKFLESPGLRQLFLETGGRFLPLEAPSAVAAGGGLASPGVRPEPAERPHPAQGGLRPPEMLRPED